MLLDFYYLIEVIIFVIFIGCVLWVIASFNLYIVKVINRIYCI